MNLEVWEIWSAGDRERMTSSYLLIPPHTSSYLLIPPHTSSYLLIPIAP
jgi:hypothetical protein